MSTNSTINKYYSKTNSFKQRYAHWDGYYEWAGMMLMRYYRNPNDVEKLIQGGDVSTYGAPLEHIGIMPEIVQSEKMYALQTQRTPKGAVQTGRLLFELDGYTKHYYGAASENKTSVEMCAHLKKYPHYYDYCYINDWWYVSEKVKGVPKLVPLTYDMCGYTSQERSHGLSSLDIVVRDADTGLAFTYDYFEYNTPAYKTKGALFMPSVRLINRVAKELNDVITNLNGYRGMLKHIADAWCKEYKRYDCSIKTAIKEAPWLQIENAVYLAHDNCGTPNYAFLQAPMSVIQDVCSAGVQIMLNVAKNKQTIDAYCRINVPEFEDKVLICNAATKLTAKDFVCIDGLQWVKVSNRLWTQDEYKAFIRTCDEQIRAKHPAFSL